jgi:hypothetical protein
MNLRGYLREYQSHEQTEKSTPVWHDEQPLYCLIQTLQQSGFTERDRVSRLVDECHTTYRSHENSIYNLRNGATTGAQGLWQSICFLGSLRSVYNDLLRAAEGLPGFEQLKILPVTLEVEQCRKFPTAEPWSLAETLEFFGEELSHSNVQRLLGQNWSGLELLRKFSDELQRPSQFHVEVQLVLYLMSVDELTGSVFNYIGCSRYSCLLCHICSSRAAGNSRHEDAMGRS